MSTGEAVARVQCPQCQSKFRMKSANLGRQVKCPKCSTAFQANAIQDSAAVPASVDPFAADPFAADPFAAANTPGSPMQSGVPMTASIAPAVPAGMVRCDMCHQMIPKHEFQQHRASHEGTREDGQLNEYPTLPPEERYKGDLSQVPRTYLHPKCGAVTEMPEEIIRTYLVNPYFYGYKSFCAGCGTHIRSGELFWESTGQDLMTYTRQLQASNPNNAKYRAGVWKMVLGAGGFLGFVLAAIVGGVAFAVSSLLIAGIVFVLTAIIGTALAVMFLLNMRGGI